MTDNDKLIQDFKDQYENFKKSNETKVSFEDLDKEFKIENYVKRAGYISKPVGNGIIYIIADTFAGWNGYLNRLLFPAPSAIIDHTENSFFDDNKKKEIELTIKKIMKNLSQKTRTLLEQNEKLNSKYIDETYNLWITELKPFFIEIMSKVESGWTMEVEKGITNNPHP